MDLNTAEFCFVFDIGLVKKKYYYRDLCGLLKKMQVERPGSSKSALAYVSSDSGFGMQTGSSSPQHPVFA